METYTIEQPIAVCCLTVPTYPDGVAEAFDALELRLQGFEGRSLFALLFRQGKDTLFKVAVSALYEGEAEAYSCESYTIASGKYITTTVTGWSCDLEKISQAFEILEEDPRMDSAAPLLEWYRSGEEMICMVRINMAVSV